jgi:pimeloyl-ACP methyl ester carboxylesterase
VLALEAALRLSNKVNKVVMYDPSYVHDEAEKVSYGRLSEKVQRLLQNGENKQAIRTFLRGIGMPIIFVWLLPLFPGWKEMVALAPTLAYDIALTKDLPPVDRATQITVPTQITVGEKSPARIKHAANQLTKAIPKARFEQLAGQDHMVSAKSLLPVLSHFLKQ